MLLNRIYIQAVLLLAIALFIASCGSSSNVGALSPEQIQDTRIAAGVTLGDFEVLRHNTDGFTDPALNDTLELSLNGNNLVISVVDGGLNAVAIDVRYNKGKVHPDSVEFSELLGSNEEVLSASVHKNSGIIGLASIPLGGADVGSFSGEFATISFPAGVSRAVSAVGDVHHGAVGQTHLGVTNLFGGGDPPSGTASVSWTTAFHTGDGDQNSETNISDLTPIAIFFGKNTTVDWDAAVADYDENTEVNLSDIQRLTLYYLEGTEGFVLAFADDDGAGRVDYPGAILWGEKVGPSGVPTPNDFFTAFDNWTLDINAGSGFSYDALAALDANGDGFVMAYVANAKLDGAVPAAGQLGIESSVLLPVLNVPTETWANININGYEINVIGDSIVTGGVMGGEGITAGELTANHGVDFSLFNVYGTYQGEPFEDGVFPTAGVGDDEMTMTQADYDQVFAACQTLLTWTFSDGGAAGIRRTASWVNLVSGTGDPADGGIIFPDDDPQSGNANTEGLLVTSLPQGGQGIYPWDDDLHISVLATIPYNYEFDILLDDSAAILSEFGVSEFELVVANEFNAIVTFGDGGFPVDLAASAALQLVPIQVDGWAFDPLDINWIDLTVDELDTGLGEFTIHDIGDGTGGLFAIVNGAELQSDTIYAVRLRVDGVWSSINKPDDTVSTREFQAPEIMVLPGVCGPDNNIVQLFPEDPRVRRNGEMSFNGITGEPLFADEEAFDDVLKDSAEIDAEFPIEYDGVTFETFPSIVVIDGSSPAAITGPNDPNKIAAAYIQTRQGNKLFMDIATLPRPGSIDDPDMDYAFRIYTKDGTPFGEGSFTCVFLDFPIQDPIGVDWSVNLWDREEGSIGDLGPALHDAAGGLLDGTTVGSITPDVLWFEFSGGWVYGGLIFDNVNIRADEVPPGDFSSLDMVIEIAGLTLDNHYIGFHTVVVDDFYSIPNPSGLFRNGGIYRFTLFDPLAGNPSVSFDRLMTISGSPF